MVTYDQEDDQKCGIALRRFRFVFYFKSPLKDCLILVLRSALEITTKLCDPEFTRRPKAADFFRITWELLLLTGAGKGEDEV
jgi:hypothetical protein